MLELRLPNISVAIPDGAPAAVAPAVERLRRGSAAYVATGAKCQQLEAELRDASKADLDAAAILAGQPAPQPGAVAVDAKLTDARKQLDASAAACVAGVRELVAA